MNAVPDLTPPGKQPKTPKEPKAAKEAKPPKEPKVVDPNAPKKERGPRTDYGFAHESTIQVVEGKDNKYRGKRKEWFNGIVAANGKTVKEWAEGKGSEKDPPRGWLRFFVQDGTVVLIKSNTPAADGPVTE